MDFQQAVEMVKITGADQPAVLRKIRREFLNPGYVMQAFRLPTGAIVQVYGEPHEGREIVWFIAATSYRPSEWNWTSSKDPELKKVMESGMMYHVYDLRAGAKNIPVWPILKQTKGPNQSKDPAA